MADVTPIQQFAAVVRDSLLDLHQNASDVHAGVSAVDMSGAPPGVELRLLVIVQWACEENAKFAMRLAHMLDELSEIPSEDSDGDGWKHAG